MSESHPCFADDGYAIFAAITSIQALRHAGVPHGHICITVEADEESGSGNLSFWIEKVRAQLGTPDLIFCLDTGALNYEQMWINTSLRGAFSADLKVDLLSESVHSGLFGPQVPCTFRLCTSLISRIQNETTGEVHQPLCGPGGLLQGKGF